MKKTINRKVYNTDTSELIGQWTNGLWSDFRYCSESLYKTKKGNYFLSGEGGPMSRYSQTNGNTKIGGDDIIPLSIEESISWCEEHDCQDTIEKYFSDYIEEA